MKRQEFQPSTFGGQFTPVAQEAGCIIDLVSDNEEHLVYRYREELISRVSNMGPILDKLLKHKVLQKESYNRIRRMSTTEAQMRELLDGPVEANQGFKDVFVAVLKETEKYIYADLFQGK